MGDFYPSGLVLFPLALGAGGGQSGLWAHHGGVKTEAGRGRLKVTLGRGSVGQQPALWRPSPAPYPVPLSPRGDPVPAPCLRRPFSCGSPHQLETEGHCVSDGRSSLLGVRGCWFINRPRTWRAPDGQVAGGISRKLTCETCLRCRKTSRWSCPHTKSWRLRRGLSGLQSRTPARWSQCHLALQGRVLGTVPAVGMVGGTYIPRTGDG